MKTKNTKKYKTIKVTQKPKVDSSTSSPNRLMTYLTAIANLKTSSKILVSFLFVGLIVMGLFLFENFNFNKIDIEIDTNFELLRSELDSSVKAFVPDPPEIRDKENPINGVLMTDKEYKTLIKRHPIAVTVNNHTDARMQHGLSKADIVMEVLTEGGITRYVPIFFQNQDVEKIGPMRSLRYYMIMFASEYADAIIMHEGQAGYDNAPWETYRELADARGAIYKYGIKSVQTSGTRYRDLDKARVAGYVHALYTSFELINPEIESLSAQLGWELGGEDIEPLEFKYDDAPEARGKFKAVTIEFSSTDRANYTSRFEYDVTTNAYKRFIAGVPHIDLLTGEQIAPKNVVIERHNYYPANDGHSRIIIEMIGEGEVIVLRDGKKINGTWKKDCRTCRTKYYTKNGELIELVRGQIWVVNAIKQGETLVSNVIFD